MSTYIVYGKDNCSYCTNAKNMLTSRNEKFQYKNLDSDYTLQTLKDLVKDIADIEPKTFPQIICISGDNVKYIGGFTELFSHLNSK